MTTTTTTGQVTQDSDQREGKAARSLSILKQTMQPRLACHAALYPAGVATAALLAGAGNTDGSIVTNSGPIVITPSNADSATWDINGDLVDDFNWTHAHFDGDGNGGFCLQNSSPNGSLGFRYTNEFTTGHAGNAPSFDPISAVMSVGPGDSFGQMDCFGLWDVDCNHVGFESFTQFIPGIAAIDLDGNGRTEGEPDLPAQWGGIMGFSFDNGGTPNYGVMSFQVDNIFEAGSNASPTVPTFTITNWAYDDTGAAISGSVLAVPEASEAMVAMLGLTGLLFGSRRRKKAS